MSSNFKKENVSKNIMLNLLQNVNLRTYKRTEEHKPIQFHVL